MCSFFLKPATGEVGRAPRQWETIVFAVRWKRIGVMEDVFERVADELFMSVFTWDIEKTDSIGYEMLQDMFVDIISRFFVSRWLGLYSLDIGMDD